MAEILNAHGSRNDIFVVPMTPRDFASDDELRDFVRRLCDRAGPFGGDGIYFYDAAPVPEAWFFNPDGSSAEFCGNGMRCLGRVVLDRRGADTAVIRSGQAEYTVRRGATTGRRPPDQPRAPRRRLHPAGPRGGGPEPADRGQPARTRPGAGVHRRHHRQPPPGRPGRQVRRVRPDRDGGAGGGPAGRVPGRGQPVGAAPAGARRGLRPDVRARGRAHRLLRLRHGRLPRGLLPHHPGRPRSAR